SPGFAALWVKRRERASFPILTRAGAVVLDVGEEPLAVLLDIAAVGDVLGRHARIGVGDARRIAGTAVGVRRARAAADAVTVGVAGQIPIRLVLGHGTDLRVWVRIEQPTSVASTGGAWDAEIHRSARS